MSELTLSEMKGIERSIVQDGPDRWLIQLAILETEEGSVSPHDFARRWRITEVEAVRQILALETKGYIGESGD